MNALFDYHVYSAALERWCPGRFMATEETAEGHRDTFAQRITKGEVAGLLEQKVKNFELGQDVAYNGQRCRVIFVHFNGPSAGHIDVRYHGGECAMVWANHCEAIPADRDTKTIDMFAPAEG